MNMTGSDGCNVNYDYDCTADVAEFISGVESCMTTSGMNMCDYTQTCNLTIITNDNMNYTCNCTNETDCNEMMYDMMYDGMDMDMDMDNYTDGDC